VLKDCKERRLEQWLGQRLELEWGLEWELELELGLVRRLEPELLGLE